MRYIITMHLLTYLFSLSMSVKNTTTTPTTSAPLPNVTARLEMSSVVGLGHHAKNIDITTPTTTPTVKYTQSKNFEDNYPNRDDEIREEKVLISFGDTNSKGKSKQKSSSGTPTTTQGTAKPKPRERIDEILKSGRVDLLDERSKDQNRPPGKRLYSKNRGIEKQTMERENSTSIHRGPSEKTEKAKLSGIDKVKPTVKSEETATMNKGNKKNRDDLEVKKRNRSNRRPHSWRRIYKDVFPSYPKGRYIIPNRKTISKDRKQSERYLKSSRLIKTNGKRRSKKDKRPAVNQTAASPENCTDCGTQSPNANGLTEEQVKEIRIQMFVKTMADKLRVNPRELFLRRRRNSRFQVPSDIELETLQDNAMGKKANDFFARDEKVIIAGRDLGRRCIAKRTSGCFRFDLAGKIHGEVASAQLWVYKTPNRKDTGLQEFMLYGLEHVSGGRVMARNQITRHETRVKEGWVVINVTRSVTSWVLQRKAREMIAIRCATCATMNHKALYGVKEGYKPLIVIEYDKTSLRSRSVRSAEACNSTHECCKLPLTVNFGEIGMNRVESPETLEVGYCYGNCNHPSSTTAGLHSEYVRDAYNNGHDQLRRTGLNQCCVPTRLGDQRILFLKDIEAEEDLMTGLIVERCGCR